MKTKDKVLELLLKNQNTSISGEALAKECSVSRAAIWKAVNSLREIGYDIQGTTNGGYILPDSCDLFSEELTKKYLNEHFQEFSTSHIECFSQIDSTNTYAKKMLSEASSLRDENGELTEDGKKYHNSMFIAESQTNGRGRLGRTFVSPQKTGVYQSVIVAPKGGISQPATLTASSAVAVCRVLKHLYNIDAKIKWINDIFCNGKKICGILTEGFANFETGMIEAAIIGIGINVRKNDSLPPEVAKIAGSIEECNPEVKINRCELAANICGETLKILQEDITAVMKEYKSLSFIIGKEITVHPVINNNEKDYKATVIDINEKAELVVQKTDNSIVNLSSGEVSLRSALI